MDAVRANLTASQSSVLKAISELDELWDIKKRSIFQVSNLNSTTDGLRLQHFSSQASIYPAALDLIRGKRARHLSHPRSLVDKIDRLDSAFTTLFTQARNSRSFLWRSVGPLFETFCLFMNKNDILADAFLPPLIQ